MRLDCVFFWVRFSSTVQRMWLYDFMVREPRSGYANRRQQQQLTFVYEWSPPTKTNESHTEVPQSPFKTKPLKSRLVALPRVVRSGWSTAAGRWRRGITLSAARIWEPGRRQTEQNCKIKKYKQTSKALSKHCWTADLNVDSLNKEVKDGGLFFKLQ